jgi:hypothetical protein
MWINVKKDESVQFSDIFPGNVFGVSGNIYMKTEAVGKNAVNLETGNLFTFYNIDKVIPYPNAVLNLNKEE